MKKIYKYVLIALLLGYSSACDQNFDELNTNRVDATEIDPAFLLNSAVLNSGYPGGTLVYDLGSVQQIISPNSGVLTGANFNQDNRASTGSIWASYYTGVIKNTRDVAFRIKDNPSRSNLLQMTRIIQARAFMILVDTYGYIPYFQGGAGFSDQIFFPVYDAPVDIYQDIIKELEEATAALNTTARIETADVLFFGDIDKWKKLGNSLLLRIGMRLSKVDPTTAQSVVLKAFQGGVILTNEDNAVVLQDANYTNGVGNTLNSTEASNYYMTQPFVDFLKNSNDPRLPAIAVRYVGARSGPEQQPEIASTDPAIQIGLPMGNDDAGAVKAANEAGLASFYEFSQIDRLRVGSRFAPTFWVTASQTLLLLAEARQRGWITAGSSEEYFEAGVRAHMNQMASFSPDSEIPPADIDAYIAANPLVESTALEQINSQYWVSSVMNGPEAWANFRRSGFPNLAPNPFPGREVLFINRLTYPNSEISVNSENVQAAISAQGADNLETKIWWDK
jgi:hypothetical protein